MYSGYRVLPCFNYNNYNKKYHHLVLRFHFILFTLTEVSSGGDGSNNNWKSSLFYCSTLSDLEKKSQFSLASALLMCLYFFFSSSYWSALLFFFRCYLGFLVFASILNTNGQIFYKIQRKHSTNFIHRFHSHILCSKSFSVEINFLAFWMFQKKLPC